MATDNIKKIPYGITDYARMVRDNYYYVDKTHYIPLIEQAASFFFLIRPRRFGKSLLLNVLDAYYDINNADRFEALFGERWIFKHPTDLHAKFLVLRFNFSMVDSSPENLKSSFEQHCNMRFLEFCNRYERFFLPGFREKLNEFTTAADKLVYLNTQASDTGLRLYLIIDEYDNFTNSILADMGKDAYSETTHGKGFFRYFFNILKGMTTANDSALERLFITGVSPITLDDVTSGFNIGTNFTIDARFNNVVGFSENEVRTMLEYYHTQGALKMEVETAIQEMKPWYDNYCFSERCVDEPMYNSDMVLYYLNNCIGAGYPPREMIDKNIRMDYNKLRHLIKTDRELGENFSVIREVVETGQTAAHLKDSFPVEELTNPDNFKSLLYYFGLLSIRGVERGRTVLSIPNHVVREQIYSYLVESYADAEIFRVDINCFSQLMEQMAYSGEWEPVFRFIASGLETQSRIRQYIDGEAHIKGFLLAYLGMTNYYLLQPEYELSKGYTDLYFQPNPRLTDMPYAWLLEVKYLKRDEPDSRIALLKDEARTQLLRYAKDQPVRESLGNAKLRLITVVFRGWELADMEEVGAVPC